MLSLDGQHRYDAVGVDFRELGRTPRVTPVNNFPGGIVANKQGVVMGCERINIKARGPRIAADGFGLSRVGNVDQLEAVVCDAKVGSQQLDVRHPTTELSRVLWVEGIGNVDDL